jgi:hypothetical protein
MRKVLLLPIALSWLTGCAAAAGSNPCAFIVLKSYSVDFNMKLASEIDSAPVTAYWPEAAIDYAGLRDQVKACKGAA